MLEQIPLFANMSEVERSTILGLMTERIFSPGQAVMKAGEQSDAFYIIQSGEAELWLTDTEGKKIVLEILGPGKFFGELSMLSGETRSASVSSSERLITLELDRNEFFDFLMHNSGASLAVLKELGQRLKHTDDLLRTRIGANPNDQDKTNSSIGQRVADLIADFSGSIPF